MAFGTGCCDVTPGSWLTLSCFQLGARFLLGGAGRRALRRRRRGGGGGGADQRLAQGERHPRHGVRGTGAPSQGHPSATNHGATARRTGRDVRTGRVDRRRGRCTTNCAGAATRGNLTFLFLHLKRSQGVVINVISLQHRDYRD